MYFKQKYFPLYVFILILAESYLYTLVAFVYSETFEKFVLFLILNARIFFFHSLYYALYCMYSYLSLCTPKRCRTYRELNKSRLSLVRKTVQQSFQG